MVFILHVDKTWDMDIPNESFFYVLAGFVFLYCYFYKYLFQCWYLIFFFTFLIFFFFYQITLVELVIWKKIRDKGRSVIAFWTLNKYRVWFCLISIKWRNFIITIRHCTLWTLRNEARKWAKGLLKFSIPLVNKSLRSDAN